MVSRTRCFRPRALSAVVILLILCGGECSRIRLNALSRTNLTSRRTSIWGGHEVCKAKKFGDDVKAADRYHYKMGKLKSLASRLRCSGGNAAKWLELKNRMLHFKSCSQLLQDVSSENGTSIPQALKVAMLSGSDALRTGLLEPIHAVSSLIERTRLFPAFNDLASCSFNPTRLNVDDSTVTSDSRDVVRTQLFGPDCDVANARQYIERLTGTTRWIAETLVSQLTQVFHVAQNADPKNFKKDIEGLSARLKDSLDKLDERTKADSTATQLALSSEDTEDVEKTSGALIQLEKVDPVLIVVATAIVFIYIFFVIVPAALLRKWRSMWYAERLEGEKSQTEAAHAEATPESKDKQTNSGAEPGNRRPTTAPPHKKLSPFERKLARLRRDHMTAKCCLCGDGATVWSGSGSCSKCWGNISKSTRPPDSGCRSPYGETTEASEKCISKCSKDPTDWYCRLECTCLQKCEAFLSSES